MAPGIPPSECAPQQSITHWKVRWPLHFIFNVTNVQETSQLESSCYAESAGEKPERSRNVHTNNQSHTEKWGGHYASFVAMFHSSQNNRQITVLKLLCNESMLLQKTSGKPFGAIANQHLAFSLKKTKKKEDKGSTVMLAMWLLCLAKSTSRDEAMSSSEEINPIALSIVQLCLAEGISQLVENSIKYKVS